MRLTNFLYAVIATVCALPAMAQTGTWLPLAPPEHGLAGWWELRADGVATYNWGAMAEAHYTFDGTLLTVIPGGNRTDRPRYQLRFERDHMFSRADEAGAPEAEYRRTSPPSTASAPAIAPARLIGQWASVAISKPMAAMPDMADMPGMTGAPHDMPSVRTFTADGLYQVRIVYSARQGHWNAAQKTIQLDGEAQQSFLITNGVLTIGELTYRQD